MSSGDPLMLPGTARAFTSPRARGEVDRRRVSDAGRVRGRLHTAELLYFVTAAPLGCVETPPHPSLLPARGEKEQAVLGDAS
ncbi:hypothetical protein DNX69_10190 [Rhodopseudomonas palustris]|uniref:Uncharacterized protein n=1 Tax=Rhodopseudomonas palustris TaxID=1076 RepID=A0A323UIX9_RHOPL|nr:hypothetical protein DNX69_10190 [Rhodopseudomonas palustris]